MKYYIGIDGGGSKTAIRLTDEHKNVLADIRVGRSNHADIGMEESLSLVCDGIKTVVSQAGIELNEVYSLYAGIAGSTSNNYAEICRERILTLLPDAYVEVANDASILFVRLPKPEGAVMICGTGSICFTYKNGITKRIGGYGDLDLFGSGADIGKQALGYSLKVEDGRIPESLLYRLIFNRNSTTTVSINAKLVSGGRRLYASFAPLVFEAYRQGDINAAKILNDNIAHLAGYLNTASRELGSSFDAVVSGGIFKDSITLELLKPMLKPQVSFIYTEDTAQCAVDTAIVRAEKKQYK